jgi:hypothetical protein
MRFETKDELEYQLRETARRLRYARSIDDLTAEIELIETLDDLLGQLQAMTDGVPVAQA